MPKPKVLLWDIECSNLAANFGFIYCVGYKFLGEPKPTIISLRDFPHYQHDPSSDRQLLKMFSKVFIQADAHITWYGSKFDFPFVNTRLLMHGLPPLPPIPHIDGWRIAKYKLKLNSNRLDTVSKIIPNNKEKKTPIDNKHWVRAATGYEPSLKYIEKHCYADIQVLEKAYLAIRPYASNLPNFSKFLLHDKPGCPACGSTHVQRRGPQMTANGVKQRLHCQKCNHWFAVSNKDADKVK